MIRITELKLPLSALPVEERRAADAPSETEEDRDPVAHPVAALQDLAAAALGIPVSGIATLEIFKRSFDARKAELPKRDYRCCSQAAGIRSVVNRHAIIGNVAGRLSGFVGGRPWLPGRA